MSALEVGGAIRQNVPTASPSGALPVAGAPATGNAQASRCVSGSCVATPSAL